MPERSSLLLPGANLSAAEGRHSACARGEALPEPLDLNSEIEQVVLVLLLVRAREVSLPQLTLMERNGARRFGPYFDAQSQQTEHEHDDEHEHDF